MAFVRSKMIPRIVDGKRVENGPYFYIVDKYKGADGKLKVRQKYVGTDKGAADAMMREFLAGRPFDTIGVTEGLAPTATEIPVAETPKAPIIPDVPYVSPTVIDSTKVGTKRNGTHHNRAPYKQTYLGIDIYAEDTITAADISDIKETMAIMTAGQRASVKEVVLADTGNIKSRSNHATRIIAGTYDYEEKRILITKNGKKFDENQMDIISHEFGHDTFNRLDAKSAYPIPKEDMTPLLVSEQAKYEIWRDGQIKWGNARVEVYSRLAKEKNSKKAATEAASSLKFVERLKELDGVPWNYPGRRDYAAAREKAEAASRLKHPDPSYDEVCRLKADWADACSTETAISDYSYGFRKIAKTDISRTLYYNENYAECCDAFQYGDAKEIERHPKQYAAWNAIRAWDERQGAT